MGTFSSISKAVSGEKPFGKTPYQANTANPATNKKQEEDRTSTAYALSNIYDVYQTNPERGTQLANEFHGYQLDRSTPVYNPFIEPTNPAVAQMQELGFDVSNLDDAWFEKNSWLKQYYVTTDNTNNLSSTMTNKKASNEQRAAYAFNQLDKQRETTAKAKSESAALTEELGYMANDPNHNYSDDYIISHIDWKKYPTLAKMKETAAQGTPMELNSPVEMATDDWMHGVLWAARNDGGTGYSNLDIVRWYQGEGKQWTDDPEINAKLNWNDENTYSPYSVGMTTGEEGRYFDVYEFTPEKIEELRSTLDLNDATAMKMFDNVISAEETTVKAETERANLMEKVDDWISKGFSAEKIMEKVDGFLDKKCPTLRAMDKSMKSSDQKLLPTTRAIDYKYEDLKRYVEGRSKSPTNSGVEETNTVLSRAGEMWANKFSPQQIETDKSETAALMNDVAAVDEQLTPAEMAYMSNASSSYWGDMRDSWDELGGSLTDGQPVSKEFALAQMEKADKEYTASAFKSAEIITDYESKQKQYDAASAQYDQLSAQYGDQQYVGKQVLDSNVVEANINGKPVFLNMTIDPSTGEFVMSDAYFINSTGRLMKSDSQQFRDYVGNEEEWNKFAEEETSKYNTYAENVDRVNREGIQETEEGKEGLQQMYTAQAIMEDAKAYLDKNKDAYDEAVKAELEARDKFARSYQLLDDHGVTTDGGKTHLAMFDFAISYGKQKPREKFGYSDVNQIDEILATDTEGKYSLPELMTVTRESIKEVDEQIADRQFLLEYFGDEIPQNYKNNILAQIADLEWDKKDREYFLLQDNKDWDEMVAKGLEENRPNLEFIDFSGGSRLPEHWANMTKEEIDRYHYILGRDGQKAADEYYAHLNENDMLGKRTMDNFRKWSQQLAKDNVALANLFAIGTAPISSISSLMGMIYSAATGKSANNTSLMAFNNFANEVNQATVQQIQEKFKDNPTAQKLVQGAYEIVYNRGRSAANAAFFGGLGAFNEFVGALPMAVSAMADKVMELKDDGATDAQAWLLGTVTLFCEAGTEMIELKHIKGAKELGLNNLTGIIDFLKQYPIAGLNEALGESLNDIVENFSDRIVMGDESEFNDRVWHYRTTMGMSKEDAEAMAWKDEIYNVMHTAIISFLSPGLDVLSFASGKTALYDHYRRQAKEYDMSIRDIRNAEQTKARYAEQEANAEQPNSVPTLDVEGAERKIEDTKTYQTDMEILETAGQTTDPNAKSSAVAATLKTENTDAESDIANAAAMKIDETFENGVDEIQDLMQGGMVAEVDAVTLKKGIQYAALGGENSACNQVVNSEEYRNATPDVKAEMLADAVASDEQNRSVQETIRGAVRENHVAEQEAILIRNGALESVRKSAEAVKAAESNVRKAQDELEARQGEAEAAAQNLAAAVEKQNNDPSDENYKEVLSAIAELGKRNESVKQYEEHLQKMNENADKARADLEQARNGSLADVRRQAEAIVDQNYQDRAAAEQQRAEQARKDAEIAEQARKDAQELSNFSRLNAEELVDKQFPNISREDRARAIRIYMAVQAAMSSNVQSVQARKDFTEKLAKKYGLTVKEVPQQGNLFNAHIDPKTRTLYVNERTNQSDVMYAILIHEITHPAENAKELYTELADAVLQMKYGDGITYNGILAAMQNGDLTSRLAQDILGKKRIYDNALKKEHSYEEALQEIVADGVGYVIAGDQKAIDQIVAEKPNLARRILATIKNFISRMAGLEGETVSQAQKIADMLEKSLEATWGGEQKNSISTVQPLVEDNDGNVLAEELRGGTIAIDTDRFSLNSFDAEEQERVREALLARKDANGNQQFTEEEVDKYMEDALNIAKVIADDRTRLDFEANDNQVFLKPNNDYYFTLDASTLCAKRLLYQGTFDYVQHALPDEVFTPEDLIDLVNIMNDMGFETPCGICYVESRRRWLDTYAQKFLDTLPEEGRPSIDDLTTSDGLEKLRHNDPDMYKAFVDAMNAKGSANPKLVQLRTEYRGDIRNMTAGEVQKVKDIGGLRIQSFSDFETPHLLDMVQAVMDMSARGLTSQAYTKVPNFAWVFGDTGIKIKLSLIGKGTGLDENGNLVFDNREGINFDEAMKLRERYGSNVGTILVGINDEHIIAAMGDPRIDFIIPFHKSGWSAEELRKMPTLNNYKDYTATQNERVILERVSKVLKEWKTKNDGALQKWIADNGDNYVGYRVEDTEKGYRIVFDGYKTESFQKHYERTKEKLSNLEPVGANQYWDFSKSGQWNAENYLRMCAEQHRMPKFSQFLVDNGDGSFSLPQGEDKRSTAIREGYWKTLIDFKMYENDGYGRTKEDGTKTEVRGAEQKEVTPNINMAEAYRVLGDYKLGRQMPNNPDGTEGRFIPMENNNSVPVAVPAAEQYIELIKRRREGVKPSGPNPDVLEADLPSNYINPRATVFGASQAPAILGNTESEATDFGTTQQNAMAIDAETGETVSERYSIPNTWNFDEEFDRMISNMSSEELNEMFEKEFGFPLNTQNKETASSNELLKGIPVEKAVASAVRDLEEGYAAPSDGEYFNAVFNGDTDSAQKMVDDKAKAMGYTLSGIHRTNAKFTVFEKSKRSGANGKSLGDGFYISSGRGNDYDSDEYGKNRMRVYVNLGNVFDTKNGFSEEEANKIYDKYFAPIHKDAWEGYKSHVIEKLQSWTRWMDYVKQAAEENGTTTDEVMKWLGYNSIKDGPQYCVFDSEQIKLADPVTYHDDGTPVSLSERFNKREADIRYSLPSDESYLSAVERGDTEEAQRMVDDAAFSAGYTIKASHGSNAAFTRFKGGNRDEMWFGDRPDTSYERNYTYNTYLKMNNPVEFTYYLGPDSEFNPSIVTEEGRRNGHDGGIVHFKLDPDKVNATLQILSKFAETLPATDSFGDNIMYLPKGKDRENLAKPGETLIEFMKRGAEENLYDWYVVYKPEQIKSSDPVTYDEDGNPIPLSERFRTDHEESWKDQDIRYSLPSDAPYLSAVNHGDMETAQRMVDEKAREAGYNIIAIHGTNSEFDVFEKGDIGYHFGTEAQANAKADQKVNNYGGNKRMIRSYIKMENPLVLDFDAYSWDAPLMAARYIAYVEHEKVGLPYDETETATKVYKMFNSLGITDSDIERLRSWDDGNQYFDEILERNGYDGIIYKNEIESNEGAYSYIVPLNKKGNIKVADPVTYYDDGVTPIPLSERFNTANPNIRYSLPSDDILEEQFRYAIENGGDVPTITQNINPAQDEKERQWGRKGLQQSDEIAEQAKQYVLANNKYYPDTNSEQIDRAIEWIRSQRSERDPDGYNTAFRKVTSPNFNYRSADGQAQIIAMMGMAVARGDVPGQVQLADTYNKQGTVLGQALQARKLWKMMTPEGRIGSLQKMLDYAQEELTKRGINTELTFSNWVYRAATAATEDGDMQRVYQMAGQELAKQIPANWRDKLRSIRMLSMLGNPRTHIRNYVGNALFVPAVGLKNKLGALMELGKKPGERTKTTSLFLSDEARSFAQEDVKRMKDELTGEAKYNEMNAYQKEQKAFKGLLQAVIDFNSNALEKEDWKFLRGHYIRALGGWMMANGYTAEQLNNDAVLLEKGRAYAIEEAQKATYRDFNKMAATLNEVSRKGGVAGFIVDAVLPFKKTPANILKRGIEYSPIGLMRSLTTDLYHMKQWNDAQDGKLAGIPEKALSPTQWIDKLCSGLSGTAIMGIGALLSSMGLVTCGLTDDDDEIEKDKGAQQYAIKILGTDITYTMDWAAPMSMPFFVGAAVHEQLHSEKGFNVEDIVDALGNISEPVFNLSMLDGVNSLFKTSQYDDTNTITQIAAKIGSNYVTSYVPSLVSAVTRIVADDTRRKAYVESGKGTGVLGTIRYAWEQTENKLPGLSRTNIPYRDVWGNPEKSQSFGNSDFLGFVERVIENLVSPGYISRTKDDPLLNEMGRLYDSTHDSSMIPSDPPKSFKYDGKPYVLTDKQWDAYKVARGQAAFNGLTELMSMPDYRNAEDSVQVQMINKVWNYADKVGKAAIVPNYVMENMGENPVASIANDSKVSGYENRMIQALNLGDYEAYETMIEALHEADVEDSAIKTKIGNAYRTKYQKAYINDDFATMAEIEDILDNTDFDFDLDDWEEKADKKYSR